MPQSTSQRRVRHITHDHGRVHGRIDAMYFVVMPAARGPSEITRDGPLHPDGRVWLSRGGHVLRFTVMTSVSAVRRQIGRRSPRCRTRRCGLAPGRRAKRQPARRTVPPQALSNSRSSASPSGPSKNRVMRTSLSARQSRYFFDRSFFRTQCLTCETQA